MRMSFADADVNTDKHTIERTHTNTHTLFSILSLSHTLSLSPQLDSDDNILMLLKNWRIKKINIQLSYLSSIADE